VWLRLGDEWTGGVGEKLTFGQFFDWKLLEYGAIQDARTFRTGLYIISAQANLYSERHSIWLPRIFRAGCLRTVISSVPLRPLTYPR
jgi:hypothetical protein